MREHRKRPDEVAGSFEVPRLMRAAQSAVAQGDLQNAVVSLASAIRLAPTDPQLHLALGQVFLMARRPLEAEKAFTNTLRFWPNDAQALFGLGAAKLDLGEPDEAEPLLRQVVAAEGASPQIRLALVRSLTEQGKFEESIVESKAAIAAHPLEPALYSSLGLRLQEMGQFEEARQYFAKAIELEPTNGFGYWALVQCRRVSEADGDLIRTMQELADDPNTGQEDRIRVLFGLGKAFDDLGDFGRAMECFSASNRLADEALTFSPEVSARRSEAMRAIFTKQFIESSRTSSGSLPRPIFIVGMMRSGTTLVEQILSCHPSVAAGGEISHWVNEGARLIDLDRRKLDLNPALGSRKKYEKRLKAIAPTARFVTDKMPDNYQLLGILSILFPEAKFIHCARHPVDTCLSVFTTPFQHPPDYSRDLDKLVFAYRQYRQMMEHWKSVLPPSSLLTISYEELVNDRERVTRRMLEFCGLEWNDACARPQDNTRSVATASVWQVRQPVYRTSLERWRNYEPWLGPLTQLLAE